MLNLIEFEPGATVPLHSHPHEQLGIVLEGMQALVVDGVAARARPARGVRAARAASSTRRTAGRTARSCSTSSPRCARTTASGWSEGDRADAGPFARRGQTCAGTPPSASVTAAQVVTVATFCSA